MLISPTYRRGRQIALPIAEPYCIGTYWSGCLRAAAAHTCTGQPTHTKRITHSIATNPWKQAHSSPDSAQPHIGLFCSTHFIHKGSSPVRVRGTAYPVAMPYSGVPYAMASKSIIGQQFGKLRYDMQTYACFRWARHALVQPPFAGTISTITVTHEEGGFADIMTCVT